eukprot:3013680-Rhodomonas_salina.1
MVLPLAASAQAASCWYRLANGTLFCSDEFVLKCKLRNARMRYGATPRAVLSERMAVQDTVRTNDILTLPSAAEEVYALRTVRY